MLAPVFGTERRILASSGDPLGGTDGMRLRHSDGPNLHMDLTPDGNLLATIDAHGTLKFWPTTPVADIPKTRNDPTNGAAK